MSSTSGDDANATRGVFLYFTPLILIMYLVGPTQYLVEEVQDSPPPEGYEPSDVQWKHLVNLCQGVLATSPFGTMITRHHDFPRSPVDHVSISQIVKGLVCMSAASRGSTEKVSLENTGPDAFWFLAVAEYLFDLRVLLLDANGKQLDTQPGVDETNAIDLESGDHDRRSPEPGIGAGARIGDHEKDKDQKRAVLQLMQRNGPRIAEPARPGEEKRSVAQEKIDGNVGPAGGVQYHDCE